MSDNKTGRRGFLKTAVVAGGAAAASGAIATTNAKDKTTDKPEPVETGTQSAGYRETDHVREYYRLARF